MTQEYVRRLVHTYPSVRDVWLFGSRANGGVHAQSDWDYLVFADDGGLLYSEMQHNAQFNEAGVDLFIVASQTYAMKPWGEDKDRMFLGLDDRELDWRVISETEARYREKIKGPPSNSPQYQCAKAVRVYPRDP